MKRLFLVLLATFNLTGLGFAQTHVPDEVETYMERMKHVCSEQNVEQMVQLFAEKFEIEMQSVDGEILEKGIISRASYKRFLANFKARVWEYTYDHEIIGFEEYDSGFVVTIRVVQSYKSKNPEESGEYSGIETIYLRSIDGKYEAVKTVIRHLPK